METEKPAQPPPEASAMTEESAPAQTIVVDPIALPTDMERVRARQQTTRLSVEEKLRLSIRRAMTGTRSQSETACRWCGKPFEFDGEGIALHAEPVEECPGPPPAEDYRPRIDAVQPALDVSGGIVRARVVKPFGEREDDD